MLKQWMLRCIPKYIQDCLFLTIPEVLKGKQFFSDIEKTFWSPSTKFGGKFYLWLCILGCCRANLEGSSRLWNPEVCCYFECCLQSLWKNWHSSKATAWPCWTFALLQGRVVTNPWLSSELFEDLTIVKMWPETNAFKGDEIASLPQKYQYESRKSVAFSNLLSFGNFANEINSRDSCLDPQW